ncbi:cytochrome P450 [Jatrophihabitans sp.]|uniref:cytochrome P450 n=1 Tax=Jatrophihabitans sp. TaxID=1932789 RepID=UPI0030C7608B|nr:putative cytochrome [Jatrophihabitans sp.]
MSYDGPATSPIADDDSLYGPVSNWESDFDHADPQYNPNTWQIWSDLREGCPVAHSDRYGGVWLPVTHADVQRIAHDTETFSNRGPLVMRGIDGQDPVEIGDSLNLTPLTSDPPNHREAKAPMLPYFSPKRVAAMEDEIREACITLLDEIGTTTAFDAAERYAQHIPTIVTCKLLGFPIEDAEQLRQWTKAGFENINEPPEQRMARMMEEFGYLAARVADHRANPQDDLTTFLINCEYRGEPFSDERILHNMALLMVAGIDTTWSSIGSSLWHLGNHPEHLARLVAEPELWPNAIEEFLRLYAPVTMARKVETDTELHGCPVKANDWMLLPFPAANVDPTVWDRPEEFLFDRPKNPHFAFGLGVHRCLGSNLARLEMRVALSEFVKRFPTFVTDETQPMEWSVGQIRGPKVVHLRILEAAAPAA